MDLLLIYHYLIKTLTNKSEKMSNMNIFYKFQYLYHRSYQIPESLYLLEYVFLKSHQIYN